MQICIQVQKLLVNNLSTLVSFWEIGLRKFVSYTTVLQQLQFKMPETVIKHGIWPLKVMFLNRKMPEAPYFDDNQKSVFLTCRWKIVALCIVTEYQCESFLVVGSQVPWIQSWLVVFSSSLLCWGDCAGQDVKMQSLLSLPPSLLPSLSLSCREVTLCGWQDVRIQSLTHSLVPSLPPPPPVSLSLVAVGGGCSISSKNCDSWTQILGTNISHYLVC